VTGYLQQFTGPQAAQALQTMTEKAGQPGQGTMATIFSIGLLLVSAGGVFGELQDSLNVVWGVKPDPNRTWMTIVHQRFLSLTLVLGTAFILLVSLVVNTMLASMVNAIGIGWFWSVVNFIVSLAVITCLFALIFKYLPDAKVPWGAAWYGAGLTALLFTIGRYGLAWYLGRGSTISAFGAAGSLAALLIWTYYSGLILFFGAEFTKALAKCEGATCEPKAHAVKMTEEDRIERGAPHKGAIAQAAQGYRPMPSDIVRTTVVRPEDRRKEKLIGAGGLALGAIVGGVATWLVERKRQTKAAVPNPDAVQRRIRELESRIASACYHHHRIKASMAHEFLSGWRAGSSYRLGRMLGDLKQKARRAMHKAMV
jgi:membrane protein